MLLTSSQSEISDVPDSRMETNDVKYIKEMKQLREEVLLKKFFIYFVAPALVFSVLGCYFPYVYAMLAVNESDMCICSYFNDQHQAHSVFLHIDTTYEDVQNEYTTLQFINLATSKFWNLLIIGSIFYMMYRIRYIKDDTLVKRECVVSTLVCVGCNFLQNMCYLLGQYDQCD